MAVRGVDLNRALGRNEILRYHTVVEGDDLLGIASTYGLSVRELILANPQLASSDLASGTRLLLPSTKVSARARDSAMLTPGMRTPGGGFGGVGGLSAQTFLSLRGIAPDPELAPEGADVPTQLPQIPLDGDDGDIAPLGNNGVHPAMPAGEVDPSILTKDDLRAIMPNAREEDIDKYIGPLTRTMREYEINTPRRKAAFLSQIAVESGSLRYSEELASGEAYEGRTGLGNTQPGDGPRFKGRGLLQLTGRANYRNVGRALGIDLESHPELAEDPEISARIAGYFFQARGLLPLADEGDIRGVSRRVNGGYNGIDARIHFWEAGLARFGG